MKKLLLLWSMLLISASSIYAQKVTEISSFNTCKNPYNISTSEIIGPLGKPASTGVEIFGRKEYAVWFRFSITQNAKIIFDILPADSLTNYDFELYKFDGSSDFCQKILSGEIKSVRSNFFGLDAEVFGRTGLSVLGNQKSFSPAFDVQNGETYYLKVSSLLEERSSISLMSFSYLKMKTIKGKISKVDENEIKDVQIFIMNTRTGEKIGETVSDRQGIFAMEVGIKDKAHEFPNYDITFYHPKYLLFDTIVSSSGLTQLFEEELNISMEKLKKDFKHPQNIYFSPNSPNSLVQPESYKLLNSVLKQMKLNPTLTIRLDGHTNGFLPSTEIDQQLSEERAVTVKDYLVKNGIEPSRITVTGFGCQSMIYPFPTSEIEEGYNRRVEIFITKK